MEEKQNFLDILDEELEKLKEKGIVTESRLAEGIPLLTSWISNGENVNREDIEKAMTDILKSRNPQQYVARCKYFGRTRNKPKDIVVSKIGENTQIEVNGNDDWSKFIISNRKNEKSSLLILTPEEFEQKLLPLVEQRKQVMKERFERLSQGKDISRFSFEVTSEDITESLNQMFQNVIEYYREMELEQSEETKDENEEPEESQDEEAIDVIEIAEDEGPAKKKRDGTSTPRVNDIMDFEERDTMFREMHPINVHKMLAKQKDGQYEHVYTVYVYNMMPNKQGSLMICEPYKGDKLTRTIYLPRETMSNFLLPDQEINTGYWLDTSKYYLDNMSNDSFRRENNTCLLMHTSPENYRELMQQLVIGESKGKQLGMSLASKVRAKRASGKLFNGEKSPTNENIENIIGIVSLGELQAVEQFLENVYVNDEQANDEQPLSTEEEL